MTERSVPVMPFVVGGPLQSESKVYIERRSDAEILSLVRQMAYITIIEPRLTGKTSLLHRLKEKPPDKKTVVAYISLAGVVRSMDPNRPSDWMKAFSEQLRSQIKDLEERQTDAGVSDWKSMFEDLANYAFASDKKIVIALDEMESSLSAGGDSFFVVLRWLYETRVIQPAFSRLSFIFVGSFNPEDLISDNSQSPLNVAQSVSLPDFTLEETGRLVRELIDYRHHMRKDSAVEKSDIVAKRVFYWTQGQPYLTQALCARLADIKEDIQDNIVDRVVAQFRSEDRIYLRRILQSIEERPDAQRLYHRIVGGEKIGFSLSPSFPYSHLNLNGMIRPDQEGNCILANRIVEQALRLWAEESGKLASEVGPAFGDSSGITGDPVGAAPPMKTVQRRALSTLVPLLSILAGIVAVVSAVAQFPTGLFLSAGVVGILLLILAINAVSVGRDQDR